MNTRTGGARSRKIAALAVVALILAAPSIWFLSTIPPLWRDIDAYTQTTSRPGPATILLHGPLYSFAARVPLFVGYRSETAAADAKPFTEFFVNPVLTDSGVLALLLLQHAALVAAQLYLVAAVAKSAWVRGLVAICLAANPLLYTFAHCVGSETLSAIGIVLLVAIGWRIMQREEARAGQWIALGFVLVLLMLTRQINAVLVALLPLALLPLVAPRDKRPWWSSSGMRRASAALVAGVAAIAISFGAARLIALAADTEYRSRIGFTFLWRLQFLQKLPPAERETVLRDAAAHARTAETRAVIHALAEPFRSTTPADLGGFVRQQRATLFPPGSEDVVERTDAALNGMPLAFALGSPAALTNAAVADFATARQMRIRTLTGFLFASTTYYFGREDALPQLRNLVTFRAFRGEDILALPMRYSYLRWWNGLTYDGWLVIWAAVFAALLIVGRSRLAEIIAVSSYATALVLTGLLMMLLNSFLTELLPRYTLPMFQLTLLSLVLLIARVAELGSAARETPPPSSSS